MMIDAIATQVRNLPIKVRSEGISGRLGGGRFLNSERLLVLSLIVGATLLGGSLRFYGLGSWSFNGDEYATIREGRSLLGRLEGERPDGQIYRLPRLIPLSYSLLAAGHEMFGRDELGSRIVPALAGTLNAALLLVLLSPVLGRFTAAITTALLVTWPEHIYFSQLNRFYIIAFLFSTIMVIAADRSVASAGSRWPSTFLLAGLASITSHLLTIVLFEAALMALIAARTASGRPIRDRATLGLLLGSLLVDLVGLGFYLKFGRGWNGSESWGYGARQSILNAANSLGWPILVFACIGSLVLIRRRWTEGVYWVSMGGMGALAIATLPSLVVYNPSYSFLFMVAPVVLAGVGVSALARGLRRLGRPIMWACVCSLIGMSAPTLVSHYRDGSRLDLSSAAGYVRRNWRPGDRVVSFSSALFRHYAPGCTDVIPLRYSSIGAQVESLIESPGRLWIVVPIHRAGLDDDIRRGLESRARREAVFDNRRFDYQVNEIDIYLACREPLPEAADAPASEVSPSGESEPIERQSREADRDGASRGRSSVVSRLSRRRRRNARRMSYIRG